MRCVGAEDPPCKRCRNGNLECVMEKPGRGPEANLGEEYATLAISQLIRSHSRIRSLETQVSAIQNTLTDLVSTLRAGMSSTTSNGSSHTPAAVATTPDYAPMLPIANLTNMGIIPSTSNPMTMGAYDSSTFGNSSDPASFWTGVPGHPSLMTYKGLHDQSLPIGPNFGFPPRQDLLPSSNPHGDGSQLASASGYHRNRSSPYQLPNSEPARAVPAESNFHRRTLPPGPPHAFSWPAQVPLAQQSSQNRHMSLPPSRAGSVGPDDILAPEEIINPLGAMSNMAGLVEAAVERAREEQVERAVKSVISPSKRAMETLPTTDTSDAARSTKMPRFSAPSPTGPVVIEAQNIPPTSGPARRKVTTKKKHIHAYPDAVAEGFVSEEEGRELMQMYVDLCLPSERVF